MPTRLWSIVVDAADPLVLARFWAAALDWEILYESPDGDEVAVAAPVGELPDDTPGLEFVQVDDPKVGKNRVHLDLASRSSDHYDAELARFQGLGATPIDIGQGDEVGWEVLADPEGNELCLLGPRSTYAGPWAAIAVDCADPAALARFWSEAIGWEGKPDGDDGWSLRPPSGRGPQLDLFRVPDGPKTVKNRLHLDLAPGPDGDLAAEVARLQALGAVAVDVGQGDEVSWEVLADPEGNELCVLTPRASFREVHRSTS
ncbi:MAG TPA: VOC family protein [Acidimicrobiales bacterium]|nr:VOC family protein [Acidimicrobiales bacterium]